MYFVQKIKVQRITFVHGGKLYKPLKYVLSLIMETQNLLQFMYTIGFRFRLKECK